MRLNTKNGLLEKPEELKMEGTMGRRGFHGFYLLALGKSFITEASDRAKKKRSDPLVERKSSYLFEPFSEVIFEFCNSQTKSKIN